MEQLSFPDTPGRISQPVPYCGPAPSPGALWLDWNLSPVLLAVLTGLLAAGLWRGTHRGAFALGWAGLVIAFVSPLCALTTALFLARTGHHLVLLALATPALAIGWPLRWPGRVPGFLLTAAALVLWHLPAAYTLAWDSHAAYWALQGALLVGGWSFWSAVLAPEQARGDSVLADTAFVLGLGSVMSLLGALLTFAPRPLYGEHLATTGVWGLSALADQQAAGLVMWVPGMVLMSAGVALTLVRAWRRSATA
ncbi:cytochrome c oxidase assembly protein [Pararhodobacter zhoushanensis]|uniref:cytochrome c oxidase assembly protein n=1 Tax=Pararhodobacter zhoushanensis TaxID=2479545 RepID=UPI000F8DF4BE|nr:cytochrome c oxidase assembly protein [Pararhodobacter zhoushanensis]